MPLAKSDCSMRTTEWPREAASTAAPRPVAPPPMMAMSKGPEWAVSWEKRRSRFMGECREGAGFREAVIEAVFWGEAGGDGGMTNE